MWYLSLNHTIWICTNGPHEGGWRNRLKLWIKRMFFSKIYKIFIYNEKINLHIFSRAYENNNALEVVFFFKHEF